MGSVPKTDALLGTAAALFAIGLWMVLEIHASVFHYFTRYNGLYFWSLILGSWGVILHSIGYMVLWWAPNCPWVVSNLLLLVGWSFMVTFQSLVLFSRLNLVVRNQLVLRAVLGLIVFTFFVLQIPGWIVTLGPGSDPNVDGRWSSAGVVIVRLNQIGFATQEAIISAIYIWGAKKMLTPNINVKERRIMWDLIWIAVFIGLVDIVIVTTAFLNLWTMKEPLMAFIYALKLKLEFVILNQLVAVISSPSGGLLGSRSGAYRRYRVGKGEKQSQSSSTNNTLAPHGLAVNQFASKEGMHDSYKSSGEVDSNTSRERPDYTIPVPPGAV